ncbi:uncharacterized protein LOC114543756 [Dendronephthya gigantea]|uniref:uncharacterized protein LOC114543756 n=1 Tax=Dendronephthya gigantea TaxID=151771 RepID=UPI00106C6891|nr:uncharacterized protein LOC114543756 [Dendronephthya gigantea]XP_028418410.1 uncharacterized protein LOC114543756 [Dendronephthya gigantea]
MLTQRLCHILCFLVTVATFTVISYVRIYERSYFHSPGGYRNYADTNDGKCLKNYFQDVLLVVVYHYAFYDTLPFIQSQYKEAFPHIVVCGPKASTKFEVLAVDFGPRGYYSFECLGKAMRIHPGYRGYMFVNDDMIVNWWNFAKLDKDKIWKGAEIDQSAAHEVSQRPVRNDWMWWRKENGLKNCEKVFQKLNDARNESLNIDVPRLLRTHYRNGKNRTMCFRTWSDFAYVPGRLRREFEALSRIFFENKVFLEIAFPTILSMLNDWKCWENANGLYLPEIFGFQDFSNVKYVWPKFSRDVTFLHPVKFFGNKGYQNRRIFNSRVLPYVKHYTNC